MNKTSELLGTKKLFPLLMQMSIPSMIGMIVMSLYNVVDTIFIGQGAGALAIAGLSISFPVQLIVMAVAQMVAVGAASIISRALGERNMERASSAMGTSFTAVTIVSFIMMAIIILFGNILLPLFGASNATMPYAGDYLLTVVFSFPFLSITMTGSNLIRAEGNAKMAMLPMVLGMLVNLALDPIFIFGLDLGIKGAAYATNIGQFLSAVWVIYFYVSKQSEIAFKLKHLKINWKQLGEMSTLGLPNFFQTAGMSILSLIINNMLLSFSGDMAIGVFGIINRLLAFIIHPIVGISQGFQPIAGYNYGAKKFDRVKKILLISSVTAASLAAFFTLVIQVFPHTLMSIFTSDEELITSGVYAVRIMASFSTLMGFQVIFSIYFQAIGKGMHALMLGLSRRFLILIPLVLILPHIWGVTGVWLSFPASDILSTIITVVVLMRELKNLDKKHSDSTAELIESYT